MTKKIKKKIDYRVSNMIINFYRTDHRTDGPIRSGPISVLLKSVLGPVLGPNCGPMVRTGPFNIPTCNVIDDLDDDDGVVSGVVVANAYDDKVVATNACDVVAVWHHLKCTFL